jgi:NADH dehydrogenase [ubiquinone] 1 alpha subcomplex assembly factor 7
MTPLERIIAQEIKASGPMRLDRFMDLALAHPEHGYYITRNPLGAQGDFTTSPEISQVFGELIGLWVANLAAQIPGSDTLHLVELGPGRGTLMKDAVRALSSFPPIAQRLHINLVETSAVLRAIQEQTLAGTPRPIRWHQSIESLPHGPSIIIANEFFDALPIRQFKKSQGKIFERFIHHNGEKFENFWQLSSEHPAPLLDTAEQTILERHDIGESITRKLSEKLKAETGGLLIIDYGALMPGVGDTLQAMHKHAYVHPLEHIGDADITSHIPFARYAEVIKSQGLDLWAMATQREFLKSMGIFERTEKLMALHPQHTQSLQAATERLLDSSPKGMGQLFKVLSAGKV